MDWCSSARGTKQAASNSRSSSWCSANFSIGGLRRHQGQHRFVDGHYGLAFLIEHMPAGVDRGHDDVVVWSADDAHDFRLQNDMRG
jgi:hypothetical protein